MSDLFDGRDSQEKFSADDDASSIDIREVVGVLLSGWPIILATTLAGLAYAGYNAFTSTPIYQTDALVQVEQKSNQARVALSSVSDAVDSGHAIPAELQILTSRFVLGQVVTALGKDVVTTPTFFPFIGEALWRRYRGADFRSTPLLLKPFSEGGISWGGERIVVTTFNVPPKLENKSFMITADSGDSFKLESRSGELIGQGRAGELLKARWQGSDIALFVRELHAPVGKKFRVRKQSLQIAISRLKRSLTVQPQSAAGMIILKLSGKTPQETVVTLDQILDTYQRQNVERRSAESAKTLEFLREQLPVVRKQVETAESTLNQFKVSQGTADLKQDTQNVLSLSVQLEKRHAELRQARNEALERYTEKHPIVLSLNFQISELNKRIAEVDREVRALPALQQKALELTRDVEVKTALYVSLLNRTQELEVVKSGTIGNIRIIDSPIMPLSPSGPNVPQTTLFAIVGGGLFGAGLVFVLFLLRNGVSDPAVVERKLGIPTYGAIPFSDIQTKIQRGRSSQSGRGEFLAFREPSGPTMEAIRSVRTALHFARIDAASNVVMLTGPEPNVGKSFVSVNLAASLALTGSRVIVVDGDLRRGHIHKSFDLPREGGLSDVIAQRIELSEAIKETQLENLYTLTSGTVPPNPAELFVQKRFAETVETLSKDFDHVIIDTPPVLAVTDAAIIARHAGVVLLVIKAGAHSLRMIEDAVTRLQRGNIQVQGTLFNQVGRGSLGKYGYKHGYYYGGYKYDYSPHPTSG